MPPHVNFLTVPHELQAIAYACKQALVQSGYSLKYEYTEVHFPETATIYAKRGRREQHFYIFDARIKEDRLSLWAGYGRSCSSATFVVLCLPQNGAISTEAMVRVRELGVGLTAIGPDGNCVEILAPVDLSVNIQLPPLERHRAPIRRELAKVHAWFDRGDWKGGFEEACKLLEKSARDHLRREARAARVQVPGGGGAPRTLA